MGVGRQRRRYIDEAGQWSDASRRMPSESLLAFSGMQPLPADRPGSWPHTALVHAKVVYARLQELWTS